MKGIIKRYFIVYFSIAVILILVNECLNSKYRLSAESLLLLLSVTAGVVVALLLVSAIRSNKKTEDNTTEHGEKGETR